MTGDGTASTVGETAGRIAVRATLLLALLAAPTAAGAAEAGAPDAAPQVYIVLIDGLDALRISAERTPTLWALAHTEARGTFYPRGRAVMPTVTNTNHCSVATGTYAQAHGIVGNRFWIGRRERRAASSAYARYLQVETLFTVIERERPALVTAAVFGKARLVSLFEATARGQHRPDHLWGDAASVGGMVVGRRFGVDQRTMDEVVRLMEAHQPDFLFASLPDVDRASHLFGPASPRAEAAMLEADRQLGRLVQALRDRGLWERTVLMVTSDHGFTSVAPDPRRDAAYPLIVFGSDLARAGETGVGVLGGGGVENLVLSGTVPEALDMRTGARLAAIRRLALAHPGIAEAWYRLPNPADGGVANTLDVARPDWRMTHPRSGELVLVAAPHHHFVDPFTPWAAGLLGNHGGPEVTSVPILVTGGHPRLAARGPRAPGRTAANPDLGVTAAWLLGVREPRALDGEPVSPTSRGRVLTEAFAD